MSIYSPFAAERRDVFRPGLADSLSDFSLLDLGRREEVLEAAEDALNIHRPLAAEQWNIFSPGLTGSFNNLANDRSTTSLTVFSELGVARRCAPDDQGC
jgi:hypothetical protein